MSDVAKTPREELECKKKYLYEYSMFFECNDGWKCQILEDDVCDLLNKFSSEIEELNISISLFEDDIATKDKKIGEQQATINKLKEENEQLKQKIQRWKTLYEIKDKEVTTRVDALNKVCEYYTSEVLFKSDVDPNKAVKEVINRILNTEVE